MRKDLDRELGFFLNKKWRALRRIEIDEASRKK
jgi:hypothetical protein